MDRVLVGEVDDEEDVDEEAEVAVVGKIALTILPITLVLKATEDEEDTEDTEDASVGALLAVVAVDADCVSTTLVTVGSVPALLTGWGPPVNPPSWGAGTRFLRKRLWLTWWFESNAFASNAMTKERTSVI